MKTRTIPAVHVKAGMTLIHHETRSEYAVVQNAKVNQVLVVKDAAGNIWKAPYSDYQQPVEVTE